MSVSNMKKLTVLSPTGEADALVRRLMRLRCVEIRTVDPESLDEGLDWSRNDCDEQRAQAERYIILAAWLRIPLSAAARAIMHPFATRVMALCATACCTTMSPLALHGLIRVAFTTHQAWSIITP